MLSLLGGKQIGNPYLLILNDPNLFAYIWFLPKHILNPYMIVQNAAQADPKKNASSF